MANENANVQLLLDVAKAEGFAHDAAVNEVVRLHNGDITSTEIIANHELIQNAANVSLRHGGGICDTIFKAANKGFAGKLETECKSAKNVKTGDTVITGAYGIASLDGSMVKFIGHTAGPDLRIKDGNKERAPNDQDANHLIDSYHSILTAAAGTLNNDGTPAIKRVALCCVSTSIFGFNHYMAAYYAMTTVRWWLVTHPGALTRITFVVHQKKDVDIYNALWGAIFPPARVD